MTPTAQALWQGWVPKIGGRKTRRKHRPVGDWPALPDGLHAQLGTGRRAVGCWPAPRAGYPEDSGGVPSPRKRSPVDAFGSWAAPTPPRWQGGHPLVLAHVDAPSGQEQSWGTGGTGEWKVGTMRHCSAGRAVWERWPRAVGPSWSPSLAWRPRPYFFVPLAPPRTFESGQRTELLAGCLRHWSRAPRRTAVGHRRWGQVRPLSLLPFGFLRIAPVGG